VTRKDLAALGVTLAVVAGCGGGGGEEVPETEPAAKEALTGDPERGKEIYLSKGCFNCHTFEAADAPRDRRVGPDLDLVAQMYDGAFIRDSIINPQAYIEKGQSGSIGGDREYPSPMPAWGPGKNPPRDLTEQQLADLVAFIEERATPPSP
jgi:mono/diheme cytochrome c family protein